MIFELGVDTGGSSSAKRVRRAVSTPFAVIRKDGIQASSMRQYWGGVGVMQMTVRGEVRVVRRVCR